MVTPQSALTLNPYLKRGEGLWNGSTPLLPKREKRLEDESKSP